MASTPAGPGGLAGDEPLATRAARTLLWALVQPGAPLPAAVGAAASGPGDVVAAGVGGAASTRPNGPHLEERGQLADVPPSVDHVVLCPGSRSAPLAYAVHAFEAQGWLTAHVRVDERAAGFTALGIATATGRPAAVVTTSGTAVANLHPAILEAHHRRVPVVVLAADRPSRLRGSWANQTSDLQAGLFGEAVRAVYDREPEPGSDLAETVADAVMAALAVAAGDVVRPAGPVLLNIAFDDPLVPPDVRWRPPPAPRRPAAGRLAAGAAGTDAAADGPGVAGTAGAAGAADAAGTAGAAGAADEAGVTGRRARHRRLPTDAAPEWGSILPAGPHTVVVAGDGAGPVARDLATVRGWPLLAEPTSGARGGDAFVPAYRHLLALPELGKAVERVVVLGKPTLNRAVTALFHRPDVAVVQLARPGEPRSSGEATREPVPGSPPEPLPGDTARSSWLDRWRDAGHAAAAAVSGVIGAVSGAGGASGPGIAAAVAAVTADPTRGAPLVVAASNPVRDLDLVAGALDTVPVLANRGLSGIDGTTATAAGVALGLDRPVRVLLGDLALLHDTGGLLLGPTERRPPLQLVVVDDRGGGIFGLLEHGEPAFAAVHERFFATPPGVDLAALATAFGWRLRRPGGDRALAPVLAGWDGVPELVVVPVDRGAQRGLHERIRGAAVEAAQQALGQR